MYRCEACTNVVKPGRPMIRVTTKRPDGSIAKENAVCMRCYARVQDEGLTFDQVADVYRPTRNQPLIGEGSQRKPPQVGGKSLLGGRKITLPSGIEVNLKEAESSSDSSVGYHRREALRRTQETAGT